MTNPLIDRTEQARAVSAMDADEIASAILAATIDPTVAGATAGFVPPSEPLSRAELEAAAEATSRVIALVEAKLQEIGTELERLPRSIPQNAETGTRVDFQG